MEKDGRVVEGVHFLVGTHGGQPIVLWSDDGVEVIAASLRREDGRNLLLSLAAEMRKASRAKDEDVAPEAETDRLEEAPGAVAAMPARRPL